jgi:flagellar biosynthesis protein FlhF
MHAVKRLVEQMLRQQRQRQGPAAFQGGDMPDKLFDQYLNLLKQEVTEELAEEVVQQVRATLRPEQIEQESVVRHAVLDAVARLIPTDDTAGKLVRSPDGRPRIIALIGPTGVGKTTTVAKLAANFKLKQRQSVGLITLDTYRIAAVDQLRTYAGIIGVPLHVAASPAELTDALRRCAAAGCDVVLMDTAGRSQRDDPRLEQLAGYVRTANPHEVHLVLSSTCTQAVLLEAVERFAKVRTDRIIFTKLDEAVSFGVLLNVVRKVNKRLSFVTTGQEVPHHIEPGRPDRLAALMLGERI